MTIAFLSKFYGQTDRGAEVYVKELSNRLQSLGHQVNVFSSTADLKNSSARVVISTNGRSDVLAARLWCLSHHAKLIVPGQSGPGLDDRLNLWCFPDVFIALTEAQKKDSLRRNPFASVTVIPNGVDLEKFHPRVAPYKTKLPPPVVLYVAALTADKRQDLLLKAAARLGVSVLLVGRGQRETVLRSFGEHLLKDRFHLLSLPHSEVPSVYAAADVFAYPTVPWESFGIAMLEAMACNLPVVATDDPIRREIVGPAGLFVDPVNTDQFAKALWQAIKTDWQFIPRARAEEFSWDLVAQKYHQLCQKLTS